MKTFVFKLSLLFLLLQLNTFSQLSFTLNYLSLTSSITCINPEVIVQAQSNYTAGIISYSVFPSASSQSASVFGFTNSATYTITASSPGQSNFTATINISQNTTAPTATLSPIYQSITCLNPAIQTVTTAATSPNNNFEHQFYFSNGLNVTGIYSNSAIIVPPPSGPTGTHTYVIVNLINGCTSGINFSVANTGGFPTYSVTSPLQNFSLGCAPQKHIVDIVLTSIQSSPPGQPCTFTVLPPGATNNWGPPTSYTFTQPGIYMVVVKDNGTGCESKSPFSITQNVLPPHIAVTVPQHTLSCAIPSVQLTGSSNNPSKSYRWLYGPNGVTPGATHTVNIAPPASNLLNGYYVFEVKDLNNTCISTQSVPIYQNIFPPNAIIGGANTALTCTSSVILSNLSTTGIPPNTFSNTLTPIVTKWTASNQPSLALSNTYTVSSAGTYTMHIQDGNNGCINHTTALISMSDPSITLGASQIYSLSCIGNNTVSINSLVSNFTSCTYTWSNSGGAVASGSLAANSGTATAGLVVNSPNYYTLTVQEGNCISNVTMPVYACVGIGENESESDLIAIYPNPSSLQFEVLLKKNLHYPILIEVYNSLSQKVKTEEITSPNTLISIDSSPGIYFISISKEGHRLHYSKLIKN